MARISIVILNYNGKHFLEQFLPSVLAHSAGHEVVVADNHSTDGSLKFLEMHHPKVKVLAFDQNHGFCGGYNRALNQLEGDYFVILNSDIEVTENWIGPVLALFERDDKIAAVQPKLLDYKQRERFEYAGGAGGFIDVLGYPFCRGRLFEAIETDHGQYDTDQEVFWASGACLFIRADLFKAFGGFDELFFAHMEEIDLCWRMKKEGFKVYSCGQSTVYHVGGGTLSYGQTRKTYLNFRNSLMVLLKNLSVNDILWKVPARMALDLVALLKFWLTGDFKNGLMILRAHFFILKHLRSTLAKRSRASAKSFNRTGIYEGLLLYQYHLARVRKFSKLPH
jgi:GT2 family glycosyltransferase